MKKPIINLILASQLLFLFSCKDENVTIQSAFDNSIFVKERDTNNPWIPYEERGNKIKTLKAPKTEITLNSIVGRSYKINDQEDAISNVGIEIIDINRFNKDFPGYYNTKRLGVGTSNYFSYSDFSKYETNSNRNITVNGGLGIKLGLFTIGAKSKMSSVFTQSTINETNRAYGELNILIKDSSYVIIPTENVVNKLNNYLKPIFIEELYMNTPEQFFQAYGGFVVSGINTGGKAEVVYTGKYKSTENKSTVENEMNKSISASYGFKYGSSKDGGNVNGELGIGTKYTSGNYKSSKITNINIAVKTTGGAPEYTGYTTPNSINNVDINLSSWLKTLSDKSTHSIVEFTENGLIPITSFIMEENLKEIFTKFYETGVLENKRIQEPKIKIRFISLLGGGQFPIIGTFIQTRFGDEILINAKYTTFEAVDDFISKEIQNWSQILKIKIEGEKSNTKEKANKSGVLSDYFNKNNLKKYISSTGIIYLIYDDNKVKRAYSIYNATVIDDYAMRDFINTLPTVELTMEILRKEFTVFAL